MPVMNILEKALEEGSNELESKRTILDALVKSRITVMLDHPWDGKTLPRTSMQMLFVTDGTNTEQAMLAVFTNEERANEFIPSAGPHKFPVTVDALWALLGVPQGAGVMINPNQVPNFRISVEVATILREAAQQALDKRIESAKGAAK